MNSTGDRASYVSYSYSDCANATGSAKIVSSKIEGVALCAAFILSSVFIVAGNLSTIVLFAVNRRLRKRSLFLVINMAFADLMIGTVALPIYIYHVGAHFQLWNGGRLMFWYTIYLIVDTFFTLASSISVAFISGERLYATYWPLKHRTLSMRTYRIIIFMVWTLALLVATGWTALNLFISAKHAMYPLTIYALLLIFIICGCNIAIWRKFQHGRVASKQQNRNSQKKRLTNTLLFVSFLALLSWLPITIMHFLIAVFQVQIAGKLYLLVVVLTYSNSFINPLVYALRIPVFRESLVLCCSRKPAAPGRSQLSNKEIVKTLALVPVTQGGPFLTGTSHLQLALEKEVQDTKL